MVRRSVSRKRMVAVDEWQARAVVRLSGPARMFYFAIQTSPATQRIPGVVTGSSGYLAQVCSLTLDQVESYVDEITSVGLGSVDWDAELLWLPLSFRNNRATHRDQLRGWVKDLKRIPSSAVYQEIESALLEWVRENDPSGSIMDLAQRELSLAHTRSGDSDPPNGDSQVTRRGLASVSVSVPVCEDVGIGNPETRVRAGATAAGVPRPQATAARRAADDDTAFRGDPPTDRASEPPDAADRPAAPTPPEPRRVEPASFDSTVLTVDGVSYDGRLGFGVPPDPEAKAIAAACQRVRVEYCRLAAAVGPGHRSTWHEATDTPRLREVVTSPDVDELLDLVRAVLSPGCGREYSWLWSRGQPPSFARIAANAHNLPSPRVTEVGPEAIGAPTESSALTLLGVWLRAARAGDDVRPAIDEALALNNIDRELAPMFVDLVASLRNGRAADAKQEKARVADAYRRAVRAESARRRAADIAGERRRSAPSSGAKPTLRRLASGGEA